MYDQANVWSYNFCRNIAYLRRTHNLTQAQMARIMGVGVHSIRLLERGILPKRLSYMVFYPLCDYFNLSADALFTPME